MPAAEANGLVAYLSDPSPTTCLTFVAARLDARRTFSQTLTRNHPVVECRPMPEGQLPAWIRQQARSLGYRLSEEAVTFLIEQVGSGLENLHNEIAKATLAVGERRTISREDVQRVCGLSGKWFIPDLLEVLGLRRAEQAVGILGNLLEYGEPPLVILSAIARQFRQIFKVKQLLLADLPESTIQKKLGIWRSSWPIISRQAEAFGMEDLRWAHHRIMETDAGLKGGAVSNTLLMEMLVLDLCAGRTRGLRRFLGRQHLLHLDRQA